MGLVRNRRNAALPNARNAGQAQRVRLSRSDIQSLKKNGVSGVRAETEGDAITRVWVNGYECDLETKEGRENIARSLRAAGLKPLDD